MRDRSAPIGNSARASAASRPVRFLWLWALLACAPGCKCSSDAPPRKPASAETAEDPAIAAAKVKQAALDLAAAATRGVAIAPAATATDDEMSADAIAKALTVPRPEFLPTPAIGIEDADLLLERCLGDLRKRTESLGPRDAARVELGAEPKPSPLPGPQLPWVATVEDSGVAWTSPADGLAIRMGASDWRVVAGTQESAMEDELADSFDVRTALLLLRRGLRAGDRVLGLTAITTGPKDAGVNLQTITMRLARANITVWLECTGEGKFARLRSTEGMLMLETDNTLTEVGRDLRTRWSKLERPGRWDLKIVWLPSLETKALESAGKELGRKQEEMGRPCLLRPFALLRRRAGALEIGTWCPIGVRAATAAEQAQAATASLGPVSRDAKAIEAFAAQLKGDGPWWLQTWRRGDGPTTVSATPLTAADQTEAAP